ncbi:MAG TPA: histidine kinase [Bacteroidales bacterium]|nr:histidine kinase [Bacteroidales bacterium]
MKIAETHIANLERRIAKLEEENARLHRVAEQLQKAKKESEINAKKPRRTSSKKQTTLQHDDCYLLLQHMPYGFALHEIICDWNNTPVNYKYITANQAFEKVTGLKLDEIVGKTALEVMPDLEPEWIEIFGKVALTGESYRFESYTNSYGKYYEVLAFYISSKHFALLFNDITERRILEKKLLDTMVQTEEKEREKFASNLHDEVGPILSSLNLYISSLADSDDKNKKKYILPQMKKLIREAISSVRDISNDLSPHVLLNNNLEKAIKSHLELCKELMPVIFKSNVKDRRFSHNVELIFYRIVKELLNNTIKHANATNVSIQLVFDGHLLKMKYADNGIGFTPESVFSNSQGMGMVNIFSRAKTINAQYLINTKPGEGFNFELWTRDFDLKT